MKRIVLTAAALMSLGLMASTANAAPLGLAGDSKPAATDNLVDQVNHGGRNCALGQRGWHYHSRGNRIECRPARPPGGVIFWTWRTEGSRTGWYHRRDRRWH
jgi:hypothetical protein